MSALRLRRLTGAATLATLGTVAAAFVAVGVSVAAIACSSSDTGGTPLLITPDGSTTGKTPPPGSDAGKASADAGTVAPFDAGGDIPAIDTLCAAAKQLGQASEELSEVGPEYLPIGGPIATSTYTLDGLYHYLGGFSDAGPVGNRDAGPGDDDGGDDDDDDDSGLSDGGEIGSGESATGVLEEKTLVLDPDGLFSLASATGTVDAGVGATQITAGVYQVSGSTITFHATCPTASDVTYSFSSTPTVIELYEPNGLIEVFRQLPGP